MKVLLIGVRKGGAGKSLVATHVAAGLPGKTAIIDIDPQGSAATWTELRKKNKIARFPDAIKCSSGDLGKWLAVAEKNGTDWVVIDTVGTTDNRLLEATPYANMVIVPTRIDGSDILAVRETLRMLSGIKVPVYVVLNCIKTMFGFSSDEKQAETAIRHFGGTLAPVRLSDLRAFPKAMAVGKAAKEYDPYGKAARQMDGLTSFVAATLGA